MKFPLRMGIGLVLLPGLIGCTICSSPYDCHYGAYGGRWQRDDMVHGRVGSAFGPAGGAVVYETDEVLAEGDIIPAHAEEFAEAADEAADEAAEEAAEEPALFEAVDDAGRPLLR